MVTYLHTQTQIDIQSSIILYKAVALILKLGSYVN